MSDAVEEVAKAIFEHWQFKAPVKWVDDGNSNKQLEARIYARAAIDTLKSLGWLSPEDLEARDKAVRDAALGEATKAVCQKVAYPNGLVVERIVPFASGVRHAQEAAIHAILALKSTPTRFQEVNIMTEDQIKHMTQRFLGWKLPSDFHPDCGISFVADYNQNTAYPAKHQPVGTNLFTFTQAEAMVRHMLEGLPVFTHSEDDCPSHVASQSDPKICGRCGIHIDSLR